MKNFIQKGHSIPIAAPVGGLKSGDGYLAGALFGVAAYDGLEGAQVEIATVGVFWLPKPASVISFNVGALVYWDVSEGNCTSTASTNFPIGVATQSAGATDALVAVRLNGIATVAAT